MTIDLEKRPCAQAKTPAAQPFGEQLGEHLEKQLEKQREKQCEKQCGKQRKTQGEKQRGGTGFVYVSPKICAKGGRARRLPRDAQAGFTLVEVLGALVVGSIVFAFAAFGISGGLESARVSGFNETLELLRINIQEVYASSRGFGSSDSSEVDITDTLLDAGAIPRNWLTDDETNIVHNFGGSISVDGTVSHFTITASDITQSACRKIVSSQYGNWDLIEINGTEVTSVPVLTCTEDGSGSVGTNELTFQTK